MQIELSLLCEAAARQNPVWGERFRRTEFNKSRGAAESVIELAKLK
jgi:hypothetical protein